MTCFWSFISSGYSLASSIDTMMDPPETKKLNSKELKIHEIYLICHDVIILECHSHAFISHTHTHTNTPTKANCNLCAPHSRDTLCNNQSTKRLFMLLAVVFVFLRCLRCFAHEQCVSVRYLFIFFFALFWGETSFFVCATLVIFLFNMSWLK